MKITALCGLAVLLAAGAFGQRGGTEGFGNVVFPGTGHVPAGRGASGFGNVVFPGTGRVPQYNPFSITDITFANRLGRTVQGLPTGNYRPNRNAAVVPYAYPVFVGGGYGGYYEPAPPQQPNITVIYPPPAAPVIINQIAPQPEIAPQTVSLYRAPVPPPVEPGGSIAGNEPSYYLIAFRDHSIYSAVAYWVDGETLHYFTSGNTHNQASLALVDRELTEKLNKQRNVDVRLPR